MLKSLKILALSALIATAGISSAYAGEVPLYLNNDPNFVLLQSNIGDGTGIGYATYNDNTTARVVYKDKTSLAFSTESVIVQIFDEQGNNLPQPIIKNRIKVVYQRTLADEWWKVGFKLVGITDENGKYQDVYNAVQQLDLRVNSPSQLAALNGFLAGWKVVTTKDYEVPVHNPYVPEKSYVETENIMQNKFGQFNWRD